MDHAIVNPRQLPGLNPAFKRPVLEARGPAAPLSQLFGRQRERAMIAELLRRDDVRVVTLTGPGGIGKTRLARQIMLDVGTDYSDGALMISFAPIEDAENVVSTIAHALGLREATYQSLFERISQSIADKRVLLVFDNFERVVPAAPIIADLVQICPNLDVLVTSRVVLRLSVEHEVVIPALTLPEASPRNTLLDIAANPAVALFVRRAQAVQPSFKLTPDTAESVAAICARLDGLPLAIELAAARIKVLAPDALLNRLDRRLEILTGGARDLPERQKTMRHAIAWSHDLLSANEQTLFRRLAVFSGGWTLDAAEKVSGPDLDVLDVLSALVDQSMVQREASAGGETRFFLLETIREYALGELLLSGDLRSMRQRHVDWCLQLATSAQDFIYGPDQIIWMNRLDREIDNFRAAFTWLETEDAAGVAQGFRLLGAIWVLLYVHHQREGQAWFRRFFALPERVNVDPAVLGQAKLGEAAISVIRCESQLAETALLEANAFARLARHRKLELRTIFFLSMNAARWGHFDDALRWAFEAEPLARAENDYAFEGAIDNIKGLVESSRGNHAAARALIERSVAVHREVEHSWALAWVLECLATVAQRGGDSRRALEARRESLAIFHEYGDGWWMAEGVTNLVVALAERAPGEVTARLAGFSEHLRDIIGADVPPLIASDYARTVARLRATLGSTNFDAARGEGLALSLDDGFTLIESVTVDIPEAGVATAPGVAIVSSGIDDPLSAREIEVLRLIAAGMTNVEAADRLFLSPRTIGAHLQRIYGKIGVSTRAAATRYALEHGLV